MLGSVNVVVQYKLQTYACVGHVLQVTTQDNLEEVYDAVYLKVH